MRSTYYPGSYIRPIRLLSPCGLYRESPQENISKVLHTTGSSLIPVLPHVPAMNRASATATWVMCRDGRSSQRPAPAIQRRDVSRLDCHTTMRSEDFILARIVESAPRNGTQFAVFSGLELTAGLKPATYGVQIRCSIHLELRQHMEFRSRIERLFLLYERSVLPLNQRNI